MKAAFCQNIHHIEIREVAVPPIGPGEILLKVKVCGLCGSDLQKLKGDGLKNPQVLGHELVGIVEAIGQGVHHFSKGDRVVSAHHTPCFECHYCRHENYSMCRTFKASQLDPGGFSQFVRIPAPQVKHASFKVPDDITDESALLLEPLACCIRCLKRVNLKAHDLVTLVGFGSVGLLFLGLLQRVPVNVVVLDLDDSRLELAERLGARTVNPKRDSVQKVIAELSKDCGSDLVLFTAGSPQGVRDSFHWLRDGGTLAFFSELSEEEGMVNFKEIYKREITLTASYSPGPEDLKEAFHLISQKQVDVSSLKTTPFPLAELQKAVEKTLERKIMKAAIYPHAMDKG